MVNKIHKKMMFFYEKYDKIEIKGDVIKMVNNQLSFFDSFNNLDNHLDFQLEYSSCLEIKDFIEEEMFKYLNTLNSDKDHFRTNDDICTPMECVKKMIDYIPNSFWENKNIKILDPCCGNGNFGAYCSRLTNPSNIWYNDLNTKRLSNCYKLLKPQHITSQDYLNLSGAFNQKYDLIMANPPYSGGGNKNRSLSNIFIEESINRLNDKGYLCFITPNNWMTYNNNNTTLKALLNKGSFIVIDNDVKKYFPKVGSSFTVIIWQKGVFNNQTTIYNNYLIKDIQKNVVIDKNLKFLPLYISQDILNIIKKSIQGNNNKFNYRCDLHNFTRKDLLSDTQNDIFMYETIHTARKTRYAKIKQDIFDKWLIIIPLSTYYVPYIKHHVNTTQSVGYIEFENQDDAYLYLQQINNPVFKVIIHLTRYGNFNNIMVLKHLKFDEHIQLTQDEILEVNKLIKYIKY